MDFIEEAKKLGFSDAAVMKTDKLVFVPEYRVFCEENACGNYDKNPACPPESGTVEEMKERALGYEMQRRSERTAASCRRGKSARRGTVEKEKSLSQNLSSSV